MKKIKVLILDDSIVFREVLSRNLSKEGTIRVVGTAENPYDAVELIERFNPDVITCDVQMPKMDGIEFIRQLMPQHPVPIIVISAIGDAVFDAMDAGAVDFVSKPGGQSKRDYDEFINEIIEKIQVAARAKVKRHHGELKKAVPAESKPSCNRIIAIGASTGGTEAIHKILKALPKEIPGIVVVQHIPPMFSKMFAERLNVQTGLEVLEAKTGDRVLPGRVIIAPGDRHMKVMKQGDGFKVDVFSGEKVNGHCPSVDVLFQSISKVAGTNALGVILTGMGYDGAKGLLSMRRHKSFTLGQDEKSSVVYGMPKVAYEVGGVVKQLPLEDMPRAIMNWVKS